MKKKLFTLVLALILCLGIFPMTALAGEPAWTGGDPNCKHLNATGKCERLDDKYHQFMFTCPDCGAKGTLPGDSPEEHQWNTTSVTPGNPDGSFPYGGDIEDCYICGARLEFPYNQNGEYCQHTNKKQISTIDPGSAGFPNGGKIYECQDCHQKFEVPNESQETTGGDSGSTGQETESEKPEKPTETVTEGRYYKLTVNFVAKDAKFQDKMPKAITNYKHAGDWYSVIPPKVDKCTPDKKMVEGVMPMSDVNVTVTYTMSYTLTVEMFFNMGDTPSTLYAKFKLLNGTHYHYTAAQMLEADQLGTALDLSEVSESPIMAGLAHGAMFAAFATEVAPHLVPDKPEIDGVIEGADKTERITFTCPHPEEEKWYSENNDDTHDVRCGVCDKHLVLDEACEFDEKYYTVGELRQKLQNIDVDKHYPNGATQYICPKCGNDKGYVSSDDEPCPESPEGLPHIWTLWYKADAEHCHRTCARCGLDETEPHDWSSWTSMGGLHHYRKCSHCKEIEEGDHGSWKNVTVTSPATCIENAKVDATCGVCNARITNVSASLLGKEYLATGHDFENGPWHIDGPRTVSSSGAGGHFKSCAVCGITDREHMTGHTWGGKTVIQAGVCDNPNKPHIEEATCTACGALLHEVTEIHHDQIRYPEGDIAATCEDYGKEAYKCSHCDKVFGDAIPPLGHDMQVVEKKDADCEHEGFIKRKCSRCSLEETEVLEKKSKSGKHQWVPNLSVPDCTLPGEAKGETCSICGATQAGNTGFETFPALGHKVIKETRTVGRTKEYVTNNGVITCTSYEVYFICERCGHALGHEYYTVGTNDKISKYQIEPGKNVRIDDLSGGIHIDGNMANDGGVYFNDEVKKGLNDQLDWAGKKYVWKKTPANSYIIEFTEEFMNELEDGEYPLEVTNGDEYWPMIVVVEDHKFVDIKTMPEEEYTGLEFTAEQFDAWKRDVTADGTVLREYMLGCPER